MKNYGENLAQVRTANDVAYAVDLVAYFINSAISVRITMVFIMSASFVCLTCQALSS